MGGAELALTRDICATVFLVAQGRTLLWRHPAFNVWLPAGGHVEPDETPHEAACRAVAEEFGCAPF